MSKKRGLSVDEKRSRLLEVFHESGEVFVLKEVEKLGVKKGITPQSIKDILQSLIDDDLVHQEKIGSANYFWSFPSEASVLLEIEMTKTQQTLEKHRTEKRDIEERLANERTGREDSETRQEKQRQMEELDDDVHRLTTEIEAYRDHDPEVLAQLHRGVDQAKSSANRWLDNIFALQSWCRRQFPGMEGEVKKLFEQNGIQDDVDYID